MNATCNTRTASAVLLVSLAACGHVPNFAATSAPPITRYTAPAPGAGVSGQRTAFDSVDRYKFDVAEQIMRYNGAHTFNGRLPPMLPAVVVLSITVDQTGRITRVAVQRSRDEAASKVALASMQRVGPLPRPYNLATGPGASLTFSETFLFNADYRFQLRTLAPVQTSE
ncbi:MAG: energy transducer TonB [Pseudomonadota bacterium]|nr:energy transducer TonB [Pseudomonadota bacterium]